MSQSPYADEGDIAEQAISIDDDEDTTSAEELHADDANEADLAEQMSEVPVDEDAYPEG